MRVVAVVVLAIIAIAVVWSTTEKPKPKVKPPPKPECIQPSAEPGREQIKKSYSEIRKLLDKHRDRQKIRRKTAELAMRFSEFQRAWEVGRSRGQTLSAIVTSPDEYTGIETILARGTGWELTGAADSSGSVDGLINRLRAQVTTLPPSVRYVQEELAKAGGFVVSFATPREFDAIAAAPVQPPLPEVPDIPDREPGQRPCWNPNEEEVLTWRLAEARTRGFVDERSLAPDLVEKESVEDKISRLKRSLRSWSPADQRTAEQVIGDLVREAGATATIEALGVRTFEGIRVQSTRIVARGELGQVATAVTGLSGKGALVGDLLICATGRTAQPTEADGAEAAPMDPRCSWVPSDLSKEPGVVARFDVHVYDSY